MNQTGMGMRIGIAMTLVYKDKDGNVLGTSDVKGSVPLGNVTEEQLQQAGLHVGQTTIKELEHGTHD